MRHFIFAGCYDNDPWYLATNLAGHLDLAGCYFSKCPANFKCPSNPSVNVTNLPGIERAAPTISNWKADALPKSYLGMYN